MLSARTGAADCAERMNSKRSNPSAATACSSRLARPRLSASGRLAGACGSTTIRWCTPRLCSAAASGASCSGSGRRNACSRPLAWRTRSNTISAVSSGTGGGSASLSNINVDRPCSALPSGCVTSTATSVKPRVASSCSSTAAPSAPPPPATSTRRFATAAARGRAWPARNASCSQFTMPAVSGTALAEP